ncbi:FecR family protein [Sulfurimonas sp.]|uniref:FecR family protein n=1 Tax=Sulfurimonas sp. TaxID=2022749 RepID=UPI0025DB81E4|nr:FecR family protein [Sulfurimonas sp.]MCK9472900.1 FecR domain-containing protein [Sulfurimonas sp.]
MKILKNILITLMLISSLAFAKSVGTITALKGSALISRDGAEIEAKLGAKLEEKDTLKTIDKSQVQIIFDDETIITVGNNSSFSIDEYLYEESKTPSAQFGLFSGAMRTITGKIGKMTPENFKVNTKTATIGIRGTNFTVIANEDGSSSIYCTLGAINVSSLEKESTVTQGFYISVSQDGVKSEPVKFTPAELDNALSQSFSASKETQEKTPNSSQETQSTASDSSQESTFVITKIETTSVENIDTTLTDISSQTTTNTQATTIDVIEESTTPTEPEPTTPTEPEPTTPTEPEPTTPTEPEPTTPTEPEPTTPTEPEPTTPSQPAPTTPTEPEPTTPSQPAPTTPSQPQQPTVVFATSGQTAAYKNDNEGYLEFFYNLPAVSSEVNLKALSTSVFDTTDTYIKINDWDESIWTFTPASSLTGTLSSGAFSGEFASITSTNTNILDIVITSSSFSVTNDDLSSSDLMSWGEWNAEFTYTESGVESTAKYTGLWVGGESVTPENVILGYHTSTSSAEYNGIYKALLFSDTAIATKETGTATLMVDFGQDKATLTVGDLAQFSGMPISGSTFASPASHSMANGTFYGAEGKEAAGSFSIMTEQYVPVAEGVYQVSTTQILQ